MELGDSCPICQEEMNDPIELNLCKVCGILNNSVKKSPSLRGVSAYVRNAEKWKKKWSYLVVNIILLIKRVTVRKTKATEYF